MIYNFTKLLVACLLILSFSFKVKSQTLNVQPQNTVICYGDSVIFYVSGGGSNFTWSPSTGLNTTTGDSVIANPVVSTTYTVTGNDSLGIEGTGTTGIFVLNKVQPTTITSLDSGTCTLTAGATYTQWYRNDTAIIGASSQTYDVGTQPGWYFVTAVNMNTGCQSVVSDSIYIVDPAPAGTIVGNWLPCAGEQGVIYSVPPILNTKKYLWQLPAGTTFATNDSTSDSITVNISTNAALVDITVAGVGISCDGPSSYKDVDIIPLPAAPDTIEGPTKVCTGAKGVVYSVPSVLNATGYDWVIPPGDTIVSGANSTGISVDFSDSVTTGVITVAGVGLYNCEGPTSPVFNVIVNHNLSLLTTFTNASCSSCTDGTATATASGGTPPYTYTWSNNDTTATVGSLAPGTYTVCAHDSLGCKAECDTVVIGDGTATGINSIQPNTAIAVYPVPNNGEMTVDLNGNNYILMKIYDELGREIYSKPLNNKQSYEGLDININYAPNGVYFIQVLTPQGIISRSIVVQK